MARDGMMARFAAAGLVLAGAFLGAGCDRVWTAYAAVRLGEPLPPRGTKALELATRTGHGVTDLAEHWPVLLGPGPVGMDLREMAALCDGRGVVTARFYGGMTGGVIPIPPGFVSAERAVDCEVQVPPDWCRESALTAEQLAAVQGAVRDEYLGPPDQTDPVAGGEQAKAGRAPATAPAPALPAGEDWLRYKHDRLARHLARKEATRGIDPAALKSVAVYFMLVLHFLPREPLSEGLNQAPGLIREVKWAELKGITADRATKRLLLGQGDAAGAQGPIGPVHVSFANLGGGRFRMTVRKSIFLPLIVLLANFHD